MRSPFAIFRKHARVLTVVLTGLAMLAFIVLGSIDQRQFPVVMGIIIGTAFFWYFGARAGRPGEYAVAGAILGGILAYVVMDQVTQTNPAVVTSIGSLSQQQLSSLIQKRQVANRFLTEAYYRSNDQQSFMPPPRFGFRTPSNRAPTPKELEEDVVLGYLLQHEADQLDIVVSDEAVNEFINRSTNNKLSRADFNELRGQMRMSRSQLFDVLRDELKARIALELSRPRTLPTPEEYWQMFRKLNVRQQLETAAVPIASLTAGIPEPSQGELAAFFEEFKAFYPNAKGPGEPGFRQPRKVALAYVEADFEAIEKQVAEVTDEDVSSFYEENKELYRNRSFPSDPQPPWEMEPLEPGFTPEEEEGAEGDESENGEDAGEPSEGSDAGDDAESSGESPTPGGGMFSVEEAEPGNADQADSDEKGNEADAATEDSDAPSAESNAADEDAETAADDSKKTGDDTEATSEVSEATADEGSDSAPSEPMPEYRPLDDDLKESIRDQLLSTRTREAMAEVIEAASEEMYRLRHEYNAVPEEGAPKLTAQELSDQLKKYATDHELRYVATGLLTASNLFDAEEYPIGAATEPIENENPFERQSRRSVVQQLYQAAPDLLYDPYIAEDPFTGSRYAYWKIDDREEHVPTLEESGIEAEVLTAWNLREARPKAKERADDLAEMVRTTDKDMSDTLEGQTVAGEAEGEPVSVRQTESFSWMRQSSAPQSNPFQRPPPTLSAISSVENAGPQFMRVVFSELSDGDVGVASNADRSIYYVARVKNRIPATPEGEEALRQSFLQEDMFFMFSPFGSMARQEQQAANYEWSVAIEQKYDVRWYESEETVQ